MLSRDDFETLPQIRLNNSALEYCYERRNLGIEINRTNLKLD